MSLPAARVLLGGAGLLAGGVGALALGVHGLARGRVLTVDELAALPAAPRTALVLGAQVLDDGRPSRYLRARLDLAAQLYHRGLVERLLLSGGAGPRRYDEPAGMRRHLLERGIPDEALLLDGAGFDTFASCLRARELFGLDELVVVSQAFHLPRAVATCRLLGIRAVAVGDHTVREPAHRWRHYERRELLANGKLVLDLLRGPAAH